MAKLHPLLLLLVLACIAMPQAGGITARSLRVPPAIVLEIERASDGETYADLNFAFAAIENQDSDGKLLLIPRSIIKLPDASRGWWAGSGPRRWEMALLMN